MRRATDPQSHATSSVVSHGRPRHFYERDFQRTSAQGYLSFKEDWEHKITEKKNNFRAPFVSRAAAILVSVGLFLNCHFSASLGWNLIAPKLVSRSLATFTVITLYSHIMWLCISHSHHSLFPIQFTVKRSAIENDKISIRKNESKYNQIRYSFYAQYLKMIVQVIHHFEHRSSRLSRCWLFTLKHHKSSHATQWSPLFSWPSGQMLVICPTHILCSNLDKPDHELCVIYLAPRESVAHK